jgi:hypothetical protein
MATKSKTKSKKRVSAPSERIARGGVSPIPAKPAATGLESLIVHHGAAGTAGAHPNFRWHGGPIVKRPQIFSSFWGTTWSKPANKARSNRLNQYLTDLLQSKYMNIMTQYGVGNGAGDAGAFIKSSFIANVPATVNDKDIRGIIQKGIDSGVFPEPTKPTNNILIIFLGEGIGINDPGQDLILCQPAHDTAFGYHSFFKTKKGNPFYYAMIPSLDNQCVKQTCPSDAGCSLHLSENQEQRQTQVTSHEFAEMTSDPELNAWFDSDGGENGDICNGESGSITVQGRTWTVQRMYSKFDDVKSGGAAFCVVEPVNPIPRLSPGPPAAQPSAVATSSKGLSLDALLPLPTVHFDPKSGQTTMDEAELHNLLGRIFPLTGEAFITDLPAFLRLAADVLSKKKK